MKIALIGYGKMGRAIEEIALERGHEIVLKINSTNAHEINQVHLADVAIEFSTPDLAWSNIRHCLNAKVPTVVGTTAWLEHLSDAHKLTLQNHTAFLFASNFSIGVNLFFALNEYLSSLMKARSYHATIEEIHHTAKKDAPSGTAVTLAEGVLKHLPHYKKWVNEASQDYLSIISKRIDPAPGTHSIAYTSDIDTIEITHTAHNRIGFASGAVAAAEFLCNKKGVFTMKDVLGM
jgi:4-hydroxy-tetrahydrodipicolinate reductase